MREELRKIYANYRTIMEEESFIELEDFERHVVGKVYEGVR